MDKTLNPKIEARLLHSSWLCLSVCVSVCRGGSEESAGVPDMSALDAHSTPGEGAGAGQTVCRDPPLHSALWWAQGLQSTLSRSTPSVGTIRGAVLLVLFISNHLFSFFLSDENSCHPEWFQLLQKNYQSKPDKQHECECRFRSTVAGDNIVLSHSEQPDENLRLFLLKKRA